MFYILRYITFSAYWYRNSSVKCYIRSVATYVATVIITMHFTFLYVRIDTCIVHFQVLRLLWVKMVTQRLRAPLKERSRRRAQEKDIIYKHACARHISWLAYFTYTSITHPINSSRNSSIAINWLCGQPINLHSSICNHCWL